MAKLEGYAKVAQLMSRSHELGIVRSFRELNFRNLLYLQAELVQLEAELEKLADADNLSQDQIRECHARHWPLLKSTLTSSHDEQWRKMLQIREKLKEYNECLTHQTLLTNFPSPTKHNLTFLRDWLERKEMGNHPIISEDRDAWSELTQHDLITFCPYPPSSSTSFPFSSSSLFATSSTPDIITTFITTKLLPIYHSLLGRHNRAPIPWAPPSSGLSSYNDKHIEKVIDVLATVISCLFPILSTVALYFVKDMGVRLGILVAFTAVFSLSLALLTGARRVENFAATAAFAAVQVVFIGTNGNGNGCGGAIASNAAS